MERYLCVHGHFYQPPRENPWTGAVEFQESALPYHDWNHRIAAECYAPNAAAPIHDGRGRTAKTVSNYARISFDFGPTLLTWLEQQRPAAYRAVLEADRESVRRFGGHGSAMAQAYNHIILPLADSRDKRTQILWGLRDFERRFGRKAEGMWLPETAVDLESLDLLVREGVRFTVLEPGQAARVRRPGGRWEPVTRDRLDTRRPYVQRLGSGRSIALFFYDGAASRAVAFEGLLHDGATFMGRLLSGFDPKPRGRQLVHVAADGETFGHHHKFGEMALAWMLEHVERGQKARLTDYGQFLALSPPDWEVQVKENTAWSCAHGVGRWKTDCGCRIGGEAGWNQKWRAPLRRALDGVRDRLRGPYERAAGRLLKDPWEARDAAVALLLDPSPAAAEGFLKRQAARPLSAQERRLALALLETQRYAMTMYTSCGWFFDDIAGIEALQVLRYAGRALELARQTLGLDLEPPFLATLAAARSNKPGVGTGRDVFERLVRPDMAAR